MGHDVVVPVMLNNLVLRFRNDDLDKYLMNFCLDPIIHLIKHWSFCDLIVVNFYVEFQLRDICYFIFNSKRF